MAHGVADLVDGLTVAHRSGAVPAGRAGPGRQRIAVALATLGAFVLHLWSARGVPGPTIAFDEAGYLGNARWLAGLPPTFEMPLSPSYAFGYSAVLAPLFRAFPDPDRLWAAIHVTNSALLASLLPLLYVAVRRIGGVAAGPALLGAIVGALSPAVMSTAAWATAENLTLPLIVATVVGLHAALVDRRPAARVWFGPAVAALAAVHPRYVLVVAVAAMACGAGLVTPRLPRWVAAANLALLAGGFAVGRSVQRAAERARWAAVHRIEGGPGDVVDMAMSRSGFGALSRATLGQGWYLAVGSLGMALLGLWAVAGLVRGRRPEPPTTDDGTVDRDSDADGDGTAVSGSGRPDRPEPPPQPRVLDPRAAAGVTAAITLTMAAATFATSVAFFARNHLRDDHLLYGRHNDSFVPLWLAAGIVLLAIQPRAANALRVLAGTAAATAAIGAAAIVALDPVARGGVYFNRAIPALARVIEGDPTGVLVRGLAYALGGLAAMALLVAATRRPAAASAVMLAWSAWVGWTLVDQAHARTQRVYADWNLPADLQRLGVTEASIDVSDRGSIAAVTYPFALPDVHFRPYWPGRDDPPATPFAVDTLDDDALRAEGARVVLVDEGGAFARQSPPALAVWVRPGPDLDRLAAEGRLLPVGFPTALPDDARRGSITQRGPAVVESGTDDRVEVELRHEGSGSPWPDRASGGDLGAVSLETTIVDGDGEAVGPTVTTDLPGWMMPGDARPVDLRVATRDRGGADLPPGTYEVEVALSQAGTGWRAPLGSLDLRVT